MRELTKSIFTLPWAASLYAADQLARLADLSGARRPDREAAESLDAVARTLSRELSELFGVAFQFGDELGRGALDLLFDAADPRSWAPGAAGATARDLATRSLEAARWFGPGRETLTVWQELANKVRVYLLVRDIESLLDLPEGRFDLPPYVDRAYDLGEYPALWAIEGLGHVYGNRLWEGEKEPTGILTARVTGELPAGSLLMLHAGIGLAFAEQLLDPLRLDTPDAELRRVAERFVRLCRDNSRPGYEGAALESLGLVTRSFHRPLVPRFDGVLESLGEEVAGFFWHGVGRAIYFLPPNFVPGVGSIWNAATMARDESPHALARDNTLSGIGWAVTAVNIRHPRVMEGFLWHHADELASEEAFANGIASTLIMREDTTPKAAFTGKFWRHKPERRAADAWARLVAEPARQALTKHYPVLQKKALLGEVFRYQSLAELARPTKGKGA